MTILNRLKYLLPARRRQEEHEIREELESLTIIAGAKELGNLTLATENVRAFDRMERSCKGKRAETCVSARWACRR